MSEKSAENRIDLMNYLTVLNRKRWMLAIITLLSFGLSIGLALLKKPIWISNSILLPADSKAEASGLAGLAALAGIGIPQSSSLETFYSDIIHSNDFLDTLVVRLWKTTRHEDKELTLGEIYEMKVDSTKENWREIHRQFILDFVRKKKLVEFNQEPAGLMSLTTSTIDPLLSFELNNYFLTRLDEYNRSKKSTKTSEKKTLIELRLFEVDASLKTSEEKLRSFREKNASVSTPQLLLEQQRLMREVEVNGAVYQELRKQYEITKIELVDNRQSLNVLEKPMIPLLYAKSNRRKLVMVVTMLGFFLGAVGILFHFKYSEFRAKYREG